MSKVTLLSVVALCAPSLPVTAEERAKDRVVPRLEGLLQANKTEEAEALAKKAYGKDWCKTVELERVEPGNRRYATLGVLARRTRNPEKAARCDVAAVLTTDSATLAAAALYELSRVAPQLTDAEFESLGTLASACSPLFPVKWPDGLFDAVGDARAGSADRGAVRSATGSSAIPGP
jgi:hypothetical protein